MNPAEVNLSEPIQDLYDVCKTQLEAQGTWIATDESILRQFASAAIRARVLRIQSEIEPFTKGSKGQLVAHPGFKLARDLELDALKYASALLLTPKARKTAGINGDESDGDELDRLLA